MVDLLQAAHLPPAGRLERLPGPGLDNVIHLATLVDGRRVLLREPKDDPQAPTGRVSFLSASRVPSPRVLACGGHGEVLVEFVEGRTLSELMRTHSVDGAVWRSVGASLGRIHAVGFPSPLQGTVGPLTIELRPVDPVEQLREQLRSGCTWAASEFPRLIPVLDRLPSIVDAHAAAIRFQKPCLVHGDVNFDNVVIRPDGQATWIDWDWPAVRYPLSELSAFEEHIYLNGVQDAPAEFWEGYGEMPPTPLMRLYRVAGCLKWLSGSDWANWERDPEVPAAMQERLRGWHDRLRAWVEQLPRYLDGVS